MQKAKGFTIVELLIVIVVIAILATLSYVGYISISNRAHDSAVQSDLKNIATQVGLYRAEHGRLPATNAEIASLRLSVAKSSYDTSVGIHLYPPPVGPYVYNLIYCRRADSSDFAIVAGSKSGKVFQHSKGSVGEFSGSIPNRADAICNHAGIAGTGSGDRSWLHSANNWRSFIGG